MLNHQVVGQVTTGMKSPTLDKFLGLGYVPSEHSAVGTEIDILVRGQSSYACKLDWLKAKVSGNRRLETVVSLIDGRLVRVMA